MPDVEVLATYIRQYLKDTIGAPYDKVEERIRIQPSDR